MARGATQGLKTFAYGNFECGIKQRPVTSMFETSSASIAARLLAIVTLSVHIFSPGSIASEMTKSMTGVTGIAQVSQEHAPLLPSSVGVSMFLLR